jgi:hypothetical protein
LPSLHWYAMSVKMAVSLWCDVIVIIVYHLQTNVSRRQEKKRKNLCWPTLVWLKVSRPHCIIQNQNKWTKVDRKDTSSHACNNMTFSSILAFFHGMMCWRVKVHSYNMKIHVRKKNNNKIKKLNLVGPEWSDTLFKLSVVIVWAWQCISSWPATSFRTPKTTFSVVFHSPP